MSHFGGWESSYRDMIHPCLDTNIDFQAQWTRVERWIFLNGDAFAQPYSYIEKR